MTIQIRCYKTDCEFNFCENKEFGSCQLHRLTIGNKNSCLDYMKNKSKGLSSGKSD